MPRAHSIFATSRLLHVVLPLVVPCAFVVGCGASTKGSGEAASPQSASVESTAPNSATYATADDAPGRPREERAERSAASMAPPPAPPATPAPARAQTQQAAPSVYPQQLAPTGGVAMDQAPAASNAPSVAQPPAEPQGTEAYKDYGVNNATDPAKDRFSTFAIDVDTASYTISRRKLTEGQLPNFKAVRAEEYLNYFKYDYAPPTSGPFAVYVAGAPSPLAQGHHVIRVALQAKRVAAAERTPVHLVYLVDVSGSMMAPDRIELAKKSLKMLTETLRPGDTVALCTYAGNVREILAPTGIDQRDRIVNAIDALSAGGSTAMSSGIELAYSLASRTLVKGHVNRVVVLSDGDANVGKTSHEGVLKTIREYKDRGITLSTVGFGSGNYKDVMMERLADEGDGNYTYIDSDMQARRVFTEQVDGLLQVVARDVKIQVEFNPNAVRSYRLIGYENRDIVDRDFRNDRVDAGEVGAGHSVTALYDVVLSHPEVSPVTVRVRHKAPLGAEAARETVYPMPTSALHASFEAAPVDFRFATAVAGFAEILRKSPHAREYGLAKVAQIAAGATNDRGERNELVSLVKKAEALTSGGASALVAR